MRPQAAILRPEAEGEGKERGTIGAVVCAVREGEGGGTSLEAEVRGLLPQAARIRAGVREEEAVVRGVREGGRGGACLEAEHVKLDVRGLRPQVRAAAVPAHREFVCVYI